MRRFEGQVAVITGGAAGIGLATARRIGAEGGRVALLDCASDDLRAALESLRSEGIDAIGLCGDVAVEDNSEAIVVRALETWDRLDVLVVCAAARAFGPLSEATHGDWVRLLGVNLRGAAHACVAAAEAMRACRSRGAIVLVASLYAVLGRAEMPIYDATKAGMLSLTRSFAVELAPDGIRVNSVCPGFTVTEFHLRRAAAQGRSAEELRAAQPGLFRRPAEPEEIAAAIAFLASGDASYITATTLMVDAGAHAV